MILSPTSHVLVGAETNKTKEAQEKEDFNQWMS
jgi:hypothetical protein